MKLYRGIKICVSTFSITKTDAYMYLICLPGPGEKFICLLTKIKGKPFYTEQVLRHQGNHLLVTDVVSKDRNLWFDLMNSEYSQTLQSNYESKHKVIYENNLLIKHILLNLTCSDVLQFFHVIGNFDSHFRNKNLNYF